MSGAQTDGIHETRKRAAFFVACLSVALCVLGSMRAVATFRANLTPLNSADIAVLAWMALPLALATTGMLASLSRWMGPIWICTGALFGFVIVAAWSLGLFYGYGALVMFVAALIHLAAVRPGWKTVLVPLWMLAGTSGVSAVFFVRDVFQSNEYQYVTHAPIVVWGSETGGASILLPWPVGVGIFGVTLMMCVVAALVSINKVMRLEPGIAFKA